MLKDELYIDISWLNYELSGGGKQSCLNIINSICKNENFNKKEKFLIINKKIIKDFKFVKNFNFIFLPSNKFANFLARWFFLLFLKKKNVKQVYFCLNVYFPLIKNNFKVINLLHDMQWRSYPDNFSKLRIFWLKFNEYLCLKNSDKIFFTSNFLKRDYDKYYSLKKNIMVSLLPFELKKKINSKFTFKRNSFFFVLSSNLKHKNLDIIIKTFNDKTLNINKKLVIAGIGQKQNIKHKNIKILKNISENEKIWLYKNCYCYLHPSLYEGFGMTLVEALFYSRNILVSDIPPLREIGLNFIKYVKSPEELRNWKINIKNVVQSSKIIVKNKKLKAHLKRFDPNIFSERLYNFIYLNI
jgi:hypothetical protein